MTRTLRQILLFVASFTLPLAGFSLFNIGPFGMTPFKLVTALLLAFAAVEFTLGGRRRPDDPTTVWVLLYAMAVTISIVQGFVQGVPAGKLVAESTTYYAIVVFYFLVTFSVADLPSLRALLWGLVLGGVATAAPAVFGLQQATMVGRFTGLSGQENVLGRDMVVIAPAAIALLFGTRSRVGRMVLTAAVFITIGGLLFSLSRTAFVAGLGMWALWIARSGRLDTVRYVIPAIAVLAGAVLLAPSSAIERIETISDPRARTADGSIQARLVQFEYSMKAFGSNPLLGVGMLNFTTWARQQPGGRAVRNVVHNAYLGVLVEQGVLGLIPYGMLLLTTWFQYGRAWRAAHSRRRLRDPTLIELGAYAMLLQVALFGSLIEGLAAIMQKSKTMWLILALAPALRSMIGARVKEVEGSGDAARQPFD